MSSARRPLKCENSKELGVLCALYRPLDTRILCEAVRRNLACSNKPPNIRNSLPVTTFLPRVRGVLGNLPQLLKTILTRSSPEDSILNPPPNLRITWLSKRDRYEGIRRE